MLINREIDFRAGLRGRESIRRLTQRIERAGAIVLKGVCFYQMHAREIGEAMGWKRLMSNSAKLVNIIGGYGYTPSLGSMEACVAAAVTGRVPTDGAA